MGDKPTAILAVDTSTRDGSAALLSEARGMAARSGNPEEPYSSRLFRWLDELGAALDGDFSRLASIALTIGPGSFTGLRIGAAAVKGLSIACNLPIYPFSTLEATARAGGDHDGLRLAAIPARRGEVYWALYRFSAGSPLALAPERITSPREVDLPPLEEPLLLCGPGSFACRAALEHRVATSLLEIAQPQPLAPTMCRAAASGSHRGGGIGPMELKLNYLRHPLQPA